MTFIDDFFRYDYIYLFYEKSLSLEIFKNFKAEVKNQLDKSIKSIRYSRDGKYYDRYDDLDEQCLGPFDKFLDECGIIPQYTMSSSHTMNNIAERRNMTLKDMIKNMICHSTLPKSL